MRQRQPLLHHQYVGQYQPAAEPSIPRPSEGRSHPLSSSILTDIDEAATKERFDRAQAAQDAIEEGGRRRDASRSFCQGRALESRVLQATPLDRRRLRQLVPAGVTERSCSRKLYWNTMLTHSCQVFACEPATLPVGLSFP